MAAAFQTIPTPNPNESAFILTIDDNLVNPSNLPTAGTTFGAWSLGQKFRDDQDLWADYVYVESIDAAPGRRAFVFGKKKSEVEDENGVSEKDTPYETVYDEEQYSWPAVVEREREIGVWYSAITNDGQLRREYIIKSAVSQYCQVKVERFLDATPWVESKLRHIRPIPDDLMLNEAAQPITCLHKTIVVEYSKQRTSNYKYSVSDDTTGQARAVFPATNFTNWTPFVLRDTQKQVRGMWLREKVTIYPPIQKTRRFN